MKSLFSYFQMRFLMFIALLAMEMASCQQYCGGSRNGKKLQYVFGDAMIDSSDCLGPDGTPYPMYVFLNDSKYL